MGCSTAQLPVGTPAQPDPTRNRMSWMCYYADSMSTAGLVIEEDLDPATEHVDDAGVYRNANARPPPVVEETDLQGGGVRLDASAFGADMKEAFSEMVAEAPDHRAGVVLDMMNIGYSYSGQTSFNVDGVLLAIDYFHGLGFGEGRVVGFVPSSLVRRRAGDLMDTEQLSKLNALVARGYIVCVHGHDDAYIITYARERGHYIVSNDFFKDHVDSLPVDSMRCSMHHWLGLHLVNYSFVASGSGKVFMLSPHSQLHRVLSLDAAETATSSQLRALDAAVAASSGSPPQVLRLLLLARAALLLARGAAAAAAADVLFVLQRLRSDCPEALLMYAQLMERERGDAHLLLGHSQLQPP